MGRKNLTQFNAEKDEWYYQDKIYLNKQDSDSLYSELKEFRQSLTKKIDTELNPVDYPEFFSEQKEERVSKKPTSQMPVKNPASTKPKPEPLKTGGFFDGKLQLLKEEIEDINKNLKEREKIEVRSESSIDQEIEQVKQKLHEIYTWKEPNKQTIEFIRMDLLKQLASLNREKRQSGLSYWKDTVFEKKDRRNLLFEYKALNWTGEVSGKKHKGESK